MIRKFLTKFLSLDDYLDFKTFDNFEEKNISELEDENGLKIFFNVYIPEFQLDYVLENMDETFIPLYWPHSLYYERNGKIVDNFKSFSLFDLKEFNEYNIFPYDVDYIGIYSDVLSKPIARIRLNKTNFDTRKYRVGLMSDIHYNDTTIDGDVNTYSDDGSEYTSDIKNALDYYKNNEEIEFVCASGDVSTDSVKHLLNFKLMLNENAKDTKFYSCFGNHDFKCTVYELDNTNLSGYNGYELDIADKNRLNIWNSIITPNDSKYELHFEDPTSDFGKTSYWFEVPIEGTDKSDIYVFLSVNYGYGNHTSTANKTLTIDDEGVDQLVDYVGFMPSSYNLQFYSNSSLLWLKSVLEQFSNKRVFVFTHQFFSHKAGNYNGTDDYYNYASDSWRITPTSAYCLCGIQFEFLNKLNNEHPNSIWFTGHSHYKWAWQKFDKYINITNKEFDYYNPDGEGFVQNKRYLKRYDENNNETVITENTAYNVHIPSTCRPLPLEITGYTTANGDSEGAVMDIYEDYVDIRGLVFKEDYNEYENKYIPIAQYRINIPAA